MESRINLSMAQDLSQEHLLHQDFLTTITWKPRLIYHPNNI